MEDEVIWIKIPFNEPKVIQGLGSLNLPYLPENIFLEYKYFFSGEIISKDCGFDLYIVSTI